MAIYSPLACRLRRQNFILRALKIPPATQAKLEPHDVAACHDSSNAVSKRSFSALKRVKTYLRSTTREATLYHLKLLHVH